MWVLSQDKKRLVNVNEIFFNECINKDKCKTVVLVLPIGKEKEDDEFEGYLDHANCRVRRKIYDKQYEFNNQLGAYSTEEKALKVLDEIQHTIVFNAQAEYGERFNTFDTLSAMENTIVYQMPQDHEVK